MKYATITPFDLNKCRFIMMDFTSANDELMGIDYENQIELSAFVKETLDRHQAEVGIGGWLEDRIIYSKKEHFQGTDSRNIHLGLDIWVPAGTPIFAPEDCEVHSFQNNNYHGDYGPTIVLKSLSHGHFYLFGHLSTESLNLLKEGKRISADECFASIGDVHENGHWTPHLHFQVIKDMGNYHGDFPGVCSKKDLDSFKESCLNPYPFVNLPY